MEIKMLKNIQLKVNKSDISKLCQASISLSWARFSNKLPILADKINDAVGEEDKTKVLTALKETITECQKFCQELDSIAPAVLEIPDKSSTKAKVLEDLPDLKEDSLRVSSGSE